MKMNEAGVEGFYLRCAELLGCEDQHTYNPNRRTMRRWTRSLGNGRYEGFGVIRLWGETVHMCLRHPVKIVKSFTSRDDALAFLEDLALDHWTREKTNALN